MSWTESSVPNLNPGETGYTDGTHTIAVCFKPIPGVKAYLDQIGYARPVSTQNNKSIFDFFGIGRQVDSKGKPVLDGDGNPVIETYHMNCGPISQYVNDSAAVAQAKADCLAQVQAEFDGLLNADSIYSAL